MTKTTLKPGDVFHTLAAITIPLTTGRSITAQRATELEVTAEMLEAATDRLGNSMFDLIDDDAAQIEKWGKVMLRRGPVPEGVEWWNGERDTASRSLARNLELEASAAFTDPHERAAEQQRIREKYGAAPTSWSLTYSPGGA